MRVFAISDIHVDFPDNLKWLRALSDADYVGDVLLLAGDVSHEMGLLRTSFDILKRKFLHVFFVPGNHDLWLLRTSFLSSLEKFDAILEVCGSQGVRTRPARFPASSGGVVIVPLFSWYSTPEEGQDSLFLNKPGEDPSLEAWSDTHFVKWAGLPDGITPAQYFLRLNQKAFKAHRHLLGEATVISFSHMLPRSDLMIDTLEEQAAAGGALVDPNPTFNFSRVAGSWGVDEQVRRLGSAIHVYGHQHRNRDRTVDGVRYISYCLGYGRERGAGLVRGHGSGPLKIWG